MTLVLLASVSLAMNGRVTYQAKIIKPNGQPLQATSVNFRFTVLDTVGSCILYVEDYAAINMTDSGGLISFSCQNVGTYNPTSSDIRRIAMQFNDGTGWQTLPAMTVNAVPYAMYAAKANNSLTLNNKADSAFVEYSTLAGLSCNPATQALNFNGATFGCITLNSSGTTVTSSTVITALNYVPADAASLVTVTSNLSTVSSTVYSVSSTVTSMQNTFAASFSSIVSSQWVTSGTTVNYNGGNVGIGTTAPLQKLTVQTQQDEYGISHTDGNVTLSSYVDSQAGWLGTVSNHPLYFYTNNSGAQMALATTGNVGIGTASPTAKLHIAGGSFTNGQMRIETNTSNSTIGIDFWHGGGGRKGFVGIRSTNSVAPTPSGMSYYIWSDNFGSPMVFGTQNVERMRLDSFGNFGIGTASSTEKLTVNAGEVYVRSNSSTNNAVHKGIKFSTDSDSYAAAIRANRVASSGQLGLSFLVSDTASETEVMRVSYNGYVGIGTTNPSYKLDVSGTIRGYGITDASDIRFKKDIASLDFSLDKLLHVRGVSYYWKDKALPKKQIGFIAQELEKIYPELVETDQQGMKSVNYSHLVAPIVEAIKALYFKLNKVESHLDLQKRQLASIEQLKADKSEVDKLKNENQSLKEENEKLKVRIENIEKAIMSK